MPPSSFHSWFLLLLSLNIFDILTTIPAYEANPVTLYLWQRLGFSQTALLKIGLVIFFELLFILGQRVVGQREREFTQNIFLWLSKVLVAFYLFVVLINVVVLSQF
ncbi:MAG: hypothetical protein JSW53_01915 [Candidatus Bathyarchaeota archaeon]|nr:MAG: hypothetical protein JSW53_01915 [Candidatus Bathyarchaeota archaeon]